jgi:hypothetical protein
MTSESYNDDTIAFKTNDLIDFFDKQQGEVRSVDAETGAEKGTKIERYDLIPVEPLAALARHYGAGAKKYADHNWRLKYDWSKSYAALQRHANAFWNGEDIDEETGSNHMAAVAFHAFALLEYCETNREKDDRWLGSPSTEDTK